jgi:hypothetical protein
MDGREEEKGTKVRVRVLVTMMAEVDIELVPHPDEGGAAIRPTIADNDLIVSYAAYDLPENTPPGARGPLSTACAHLIVQMAGRRIDRKLNRFAPDEPMPGPTQPMGSA